MNKRIRKKVAKQLVLGGKAHKAIRIVAVSNSGTIDCPCYQAVINSGKLRRAIMELAYSIDPLCSHWDSPLRIENLERCGAKIPQSLG